MIKMLKNKSNALTLLMVLLSNFLFAGGDVDMADKMRADGKIYVVVAVLLIIFVGIAVYIFSIDKKLSKLEKEIKSKKIKWHSSDTD